MVAFQDRAGFTQKDAENLERVKDAMAEHAVGKTGVLGSGPDAAAAAAFAQLLDAETRRQELALRSAKKGVTPQALPAEPGSWIERAAEAGQPENGLAQVN